MWWLFMNRTTGSTIFNTLYWLFPVLLTGLVFFDESKTAIYGIIITKKKRCVYLCSKALSVFFVSFVSTLFLFLFNLFYMMERCRIFAVCKAGGDGVAIHSKCGMLFSLLPKDLLFNSRQQGKASAS